MQSYLLINCLSREDNCEFMGEHGDVPAFLYSLLAIIFLHFLICLNIIFIFDTLK